MSEARHDGRVVEIVDTTTALVMVRYVDTGEIKYVLRRTVTPPSCPACDHELMLPEPLGTPGDESYYCEGCGKPWSLDLTHEVL